MFWLIAVLIVLFIITWVTIGHKADHGQYAATCGRLQEVSTKVDRQEDAHRSWPRDPHQHPLDTEITLELQHRKTNKEGDYYLRIAPTHDMWGNVYHSKTPGRTVKLRDLLNRLLENAPAELIEPVSADFRFVNPTFGPAIGSAVGQISGLAFKGAEPDANCRTTPDGGCEAAGCMHDPQRAWVLPELAAVFGIPLVAPRTMKPINFNAHECGLDVTDNFHI